VTEQFVLGNALFLIDFRKDYGTQFSEALPLPVGKGNK